MNEPFPISPAAERNKQPILEILAMQLPDSGEVLEIASGTGQHIAHFAAELPNLRWQPTEPGDEDRAVIDLRVYAAGLTNVRPAVALDVMSADWQLTAQFDALVCINMIHIAPWPATDALFAGAARLVRAGGKVVLYGPFLERGTAVQSNLDFDVWLKRRNPDSGLRELADVIRVATTHGFAQTRIYPMPANNLAVVFDQAA